MQIHCGSRKAVFLAAVSAGQFRPENKTPNKLPSLALLSLVLVATFAHAAPDRFATQVLADGPIGYWRFNEASLSDGALDRSGRPNRSDGTYSATGITLGQPAPAGGDPAALFDGSTGRVIVPNSEILNRPHITMEAKVAWFGSTSDKAGQPIQQRILEKSSFPQLAQYGLSVTAAGHVRVELRTSSATTSVDVESIASVAPAVETHVVADLRRPEHPNLSQRASGQRVSRARQH